MVKESEMFYFPRRMCSNTGFFDWSYVIGNNVSLCANSSIGILPSQYNKTTKKLVLKIFSGFLMHSDIWNHPHFKFTRRSHQWTLTQLSHY